MSARSRTWVGPILLATALVAGCGLSANENTVAPRAQEDLLGYLDSATGDEGFALLVAEGPNANEQEVVDIFASAWLAEMAQDTGDSTSELEADDLASDPAAVEAVLPVPAHWRAWAWIQIGEGSQPTSPQAILRAREALLSGGERVPDDSTDEDVRLWVEDIAVGHSINTIPPDEIRARVLAMFDAGPVSLTSAQRLFAVCDRNTWDCPAITLRWEHASVTDIAAALDLAAAAELVQGGHPVRGFECARATEQANEVLDALGPADYLLAARMAKVLSTCDGPPDQAKNYLAEAESRRVQPSGGVALYMPAVGSLQATYAARRILGDRFEDFVADRPTRETAAGLLEQGSLDPVAELLAIAIITPYGDRPDPEFDPTIDSAALRLADRSVSVPDAPPVVTQLRLLDELGVSVEGVQVSPTAVDATPEEAILDALIAAGLGLIENDEEILRYYAPYISSLGPVTLEQGRSSPLFGKRLRVLDLTGFKPDIKWQDSLRQVMSNGYTCDGSAYLLALEANHTNSCDILASAEMLESDLALAALDTASEQ